jgi:hypothetical protein
LKNENIHQLITMRSYWNSLAKTEPTGEGAEIAKEKCKRWESEAANSMESIRSIEMLAHNELSLESFNCADDSSGIQINRFNHVKSSQRESKQDKRKKEKSLDDHNKDVVIFRLIP